MPLLPFLKNKRKEASVIVQERAPDDNPDQGPEDEQAPLKAAAQDILRAISDNDAEHLALAIQAAFQICDSAPHDEAESSDEPESEQE